MKEKDIDRLINSAFGELSQADEAALLRELQSDPELEKELAAYQSLAGDLRLASHVDECQVSPEMLRDAIFAAPQAAPKVISLWARPSTWAPLALAACALAAVMYVRQTPRSFVVDKPTEMTPVATTVVPKENPKPSLDNKGIDLVPPVSKSVVAPLDSGDDVIEVPAPRAAKVTHRSHRANRPTWSEKGITVPIVKEPVTTPDATGLTAADITAKAAPGMNITAPAETTVREEVVVINQYQDATGTPVATEVPKSNDFTISG